MELIFAPTERSVIVSPTWDAGVAMPVTAKLSKKLYEKLGHDVVDELVDWFNRVDASYRTEFRDLFEAHFGRFDAKLEQRVAQLDAKGEQRTAQLDAKWEQRHVELRAELRTELGATRSAMLQALADLRGELRAEIAGARADTIRWNFLFWIGTLGTVVALVKLG